MNSLILPEFKHIQDFMPIQVIWKFHKVSIKTKQAIRRTRSNMGFFCTKGQVTLKSKVRSGQNSNSWGCMPVHVICKFHKDLMIPIWPKKYMLRTRSNTVFSVTQGRITLKWIVRSGLKLNASKILWLSSTVCNTASLMKTWKWSCYPPDNIFHIISLWEPSARH